MKFRQSLQICLLVPLLVPSVSALAINEKESTVDTYGRIPLYFDVNQGQADSQVKFLSRGKGYTLFLTPGEAVLTLRVPVDSFVGAGQEGHYQEQSRQGLG